MEDRFVLVLVDDEPGITRSKPIIAAGIFTR